VVIPDKIVIQLINESGQPFKQDRVLIGIRTFAISKNNIDLYPFLSDKEGNFVITKKELQDSASRFVSYGLMDYSSLESASPDIEIYLFTEEQIKQYVNYWEPKANRKIKDFPLINMIPEDKKEDFIRQYEEGRAKESEQLIKFKTSYNNQLNALQTQAIKGQWDGVRDIYKYEMKIKPL